MTWSFHELHRAIIEQIVIAIDFKYVQLANVSKVILTIDGFSPLIRP